MKGGRAPLGYTIIEVMIVLAVSAVTFLMAVTFINGRQQKTSFSSGVSEMASRLQDVMEQVTDGRYTDQQFTCQVTGSGSAAHLTFSNGGGGAQGANAPCVFLGKLVHFYISGSTLPQNYEVMPLAQPRLDPLQNTPQPLTEITQFSRPIYDNFGGNQVDLRVQASIPQTLGVSQMIVYNIAGSPDATSASNIGFMPSLDNANSSTSGAQTLKLIYTPGLTSGDSPTSPPGLPKSVQQVRNNHLAYAKSVKICLTDGTRFANIRVGYIDDSGNVVDQPTVNVEQRGTAGC
jgi:prepilin-type N-terminal cleavage/methylation domain-containing protein